jgi:hypothetical protein
MPYQGIHLNFFDSTKGKNMLARDKIPGKERKNI